MVPSGDVKLFLNFLELLSDGAGSKELNVLYNIVPLCDSVVSESLCYYGPRVRATCPGHALVTHIIHFNRICRCYLLKKQSWQTDQSKALI